MIPYLIKTFRGGISDESNKGIVGSYKHGYGLSIHKRNDSLSCGSTMATIFGESLGVFGSSSAGTIQTGIINVFLPISDGSLLAFTDRGSIWCMSGDGQWQFVYNDPAGKITGAAEFEDTNGNNYVFWATQTMISRKLYPGSFSTAPDTGTNRWGDVEWEWKTENILTTKLTDNWHTMKVSSGALTVANREALATYTFDAAFDPSAMNVRPGNIIKCLEERNDFTIMGSTRLDESEEGHIWSWVDTALNYVQKKKIPVKGINSLIYTELPLLQGGDQGELFFSDFVNVVPLNGIPGGGQTNPYGVTIEDDIALFGIYGGSAVSYPGIWSYGRKRKNRPFALNYNYRLSPTINGSTISTIGAVVNYNGITFVSWGTEDSHTSGTTSEYGVDSVVSTTAASAVFEALEFDAGRTFDKKWVDTVKVTTALIPSGTSYSVKFKMDKEVDWRYAVLPDNTTTYSTANSIESEWQLGKPGMIYEVGAELNPSGSDTPEILSITSYINPKGYIHG